jgi:hypothetical protein
MNVSNWTYVVHNGLLLGENSNKHTIEMEKHIGIYFAPLEKKIAFTNNYNFEDRTCVNQNFALDYLL